MNLNIVRSLLQGEDLAPEQSSLDFLSQTLASAVSSNPTSHQIFCQELSGYGPRQVCQYQFKTNDIVWICKQCQKDDTCVLCNRCYQSSDHTGHEVYFYHSAAGGCCDCGDVDAWSPAGFCTMHGKRSSNPISFLPTPLREHASDMFVMLFDCFEQCCDWYCRLQDFDFINNSDEEFAMYLYLDDFHTWAELNAWLSAIAIHNQLGGPPDEQSEQLMQQRGYLRLKSGLTMTPSISMLVQLLRQKCTIRMLNNRQELAHKAVVLSLQWLREIALSCDGLCSLACTILDSDRLCRLMLHDMYLDKEIGVAFHNLLLSLMADQSFKMTSAVAYALAYRKICSDFSRGIGMVGNTIFNLSVQFLNREHFVNEVAYHHNLLEHGVMALQDMLRVVLPADNSFFQSLSITKRRYTVVIGDFKIIFTIPEISRYFSTSCLTPWLRILEGVQKLHIQNRAFDSHVLYEDRQWMQAFNLILGLSSLFDHLTNWFYDCSSSSKKLRASSSVTKAQNVQVSLIDVQQVLTLIIQKCFEWQQNSKENTYAENAAAIMDEASSMTCQELMNPSGQQIILRYFSLLFIRGESKSFHFPLHRYLACNIIEASKHPHLTSTLYSIGLLLAEESKSTLSMVYSILHPILFAMEVRQGKWKRNGGCVYDQLMNYSESPFCRIFRDLDVVILQLVLIVIPIPLFLVFLFNEACVVKIVLQDGLDFVGTSCPIEPDFTAGMIVDCLHLLINIVTELPAPANANLFERCSQQIKREWIHKLAAESCTYSQLQDVLSSSSDFTKLPSSDLDKLLHDISVRNQVSALAVPTYSLKRELWSEYDPSFPHLNETGHQSATEKKPKATASQPMVRRCLPAHECFEDVRIKVLFEPLLLQSMHNLLHAAAWKFLRHGDYDRQRLLDVSFDCNDNVVHKIVHLLTLATHEAKALLEATCSNEEHSMVMAFFASLCQEGMLTVSWVGETVTKFDSSTFRTLFKLMKHYEEVGEATFMHNIGWLLNQCAALHSQCKILYDELQPPVVNEQNGQGNGAGVLDFDALKKQNAARVLQSMQAAASVFLASLEDISDSDEDNEEEDKMGGMTEVEGKGSVGDHVQVEAVMDVANSPANNTKTTAPVMDEEPEDEHLCIICQTELDQEDEEEGEPDYIGYLAFLQYSSLNHGDITNKHMHLVEPVAKAPHDQVLRGNWNACNARIGFCGHMMHRTCFTAYQASQHNTNADQNFMIVDTSQGQATCPLCKKLCNMLVPVVPKTKDQSMQVEEDNSVFSPVAWMRNFRIARQNAELSFPQLWYSSLLSPAGTCSNSSCMLLRNFLHELHNFIPESNSIENLVNISAYTLCGDLAEHQVPGYHLPLVQHAISEYRSQVDSTSLSFGKYSPGFDDVKKTAALVDIVGQYYNDADSNDLSTLLQQLMGRLCPGVPHDSRADEHIDPDQWIPENGNVLPPILDLPLIDMSILAGALSLALNNGAADKSCINLLPWFAVARLGQICLHHELVSTDQSTVDSALWPSLWPLLAMFIDTEYMDAQRLSQLNVQNIALEWVTHIRACIHIFSRIPLNVLKYRYLEALGKSGDKSWLIAPLSTQVVNDAMVRGYMELLGIDLLVKSPEELMPSLRYWQSDCLETIGRSAENKVDTFSYRSRGRFLSYPRYRPFQLLPLPADYSRLHATITSQCSYEQPALCLVCGAILNSAGQGQCFTHSLTCNQGAGAYLLVQDCNIVLTFGPRSAYFPSVYLDIYGEIHKSYRGKPLHLNQERYEALRTLWASHGIPIDVILKRSSANRVIIVGYY